MALSRRSLFAGAAALPALVPAIVAARPFASGGVAKSAPLIFPRLVISPATKWRHLRGCLGEYGPEILFPLKRNARGLLSIVAIADKPAADEIDDRAFGFEG